MKKAKIFVCVTLFSLGLLLLPVSFVCAPAQANIIDIIEIEPDWFRDGTDVSNLFAGVTINTLTNPNRSGILTYTPRYASGGSLGGTYLANEAVEAWRRTKLGLPNSTNFDEFTAMIVEFDTPTNFFEIDSRWWSDNTAIYAFGTNDQWVAECSNWGRCSGPASSSSWPTTGYWSNEGTLQVGSLESDPFIQTLIIGGFSGQAVLDRMRFNRVPAHSVPEPSTMFLLATGLVGLIGFRRKWAK